MVSSFSSIEWWFQEDESGPVDPVDLKVTDFIRVVQWRVGREVHPFKVQGLDFESQ